MQLHEASGKEVKITLKNGMVFVGIAYDYTSEVDNEPDPESISIGNTEIFAPEILKIEVIS